MISAIICTMCGDEFTDYVHAHRHNRVEHGGAAQMKKIRTKQLTEFA